MTLVLISTEYPPGPGGIGTHAWELSRNLSYLGLEVKVLCPLDHLDTSTVKAFDFSQDFEISRWPYSRLAPCKVLRRIICSINKCGLWKASCLLVSGSRAVLYGFVVAKILRIPYIAIGHGAEFSTPKGLRKYLVKMAFKKANKVVCVSHFTRRAAESFGVQKEKIQVIYNGADATAFSPDLDVEPLRKKGLGLNNQRVILTVGAVSDRKAQDMVIRAMPMILQECPEALYLIVGLPLKKGEYLQIARSIGVDRRVRFVGTVRAKDLAKYYNLCDVFVLNSRIAADGENEGFGIVLVEASLCGKPIVGTRGCGIEEVIVDGETGYLVDPDSPEQTANAITKLLKEPQKARVMGDKARERALSMFTWERCGKEFYDLIMNLKE